MLIISVTSVISNLLEIERLELLRQLFTTVVITPAVERELYKRLDHKIVLKQLEWISVLVPRNQTLVNELAEVLDPGESESIALAVERNAAYPLIDERMG